MVHPEPGYWTMWPSCCPHAWDDDFGLDDEFRLDELWHAWAQWVISERVDEVIQDYSFEEGISQEAYLETVFQKSRGVLYGDKYEEGPPSEEETQENSERQTERTEFFANLGSVQELKDFMLKMKRVLHFIITDTTTEGIGTSIKLFNLSVSEEFRLSILNAMNSHNWEKVESMIMPIAVAFPGRTAVHEAFVISAALLLSVVYQYLIGLVDRGGGKIYSSGSLEFRSIYISIVLFQGAYIWIKFRNVAPDSPRKPSPGLYRKCKVSKSGVKVYHGNYEPRFKPPGSENYISVGSFEKEEDAKNIYQILAFYYGKDVQGKLTLLDGSTYPIPPMTEEEKRLNPEEKKEWVKGKAKAIIKECKGVLESMVRGFLLDSEIQPIEDVLNILPPPGCPDASAGLFAMDCSGVRAEAYPFQLGNQGDNLILVPPNNCSPNVHPVTPGIQEHMVNDTLSGHVVGDPSHLTLPGTATNTPANGAGVPDEQPLETQFQYGSLQENQASNNSANNVILDDGGLLRQVKELQRQQQFQQLLSQQLEARLVELDRQQQLQQLLNQQQEIRNSELERQQQLQQLLNQQQESRISELEGEVERLRSTEYARKRSCSGLTSRHNSQN